MLVHVKNTAKTWAVQCQVDGGDFCYEKNDILVVASLIYGIFKKDQIQLELTRIISSYEKRASAVLPLFNGYYFFAIIDKRNRRIELKKDPVGVVTGYYVKNGNDFYFGTNMHALAKASGLIDFNPVAVSLILTTGWFYEGLTYYQHVQELLMGQTLRYDDGFNVVYNDVTSIELPRHEEEMSFEDAVRRLRVLTIQAHEKLAGSKNVVLLSGGIDSCVMMASLNNVCSKDKIQNVTFRVKDTVFDETPYAVAAGKHLGIETQVITVDPTNREIFIDFDEKLLTTNCPAIGMWIYNIRDKTTDTMCFAGQDTRLHTPPNDRIYQIFLYLLKEKKRGALHQAFLQMAISPALVCIRQMQNSFGQNRPLYLAERILCLSNPEDYLKRYLLAFNPTRCQIPIPQPIQEEIDELFKIDFKDVESSPRAVFNAIIEKEWRAQFVSDIRYMQGIGRINGVTTAMPFYDAELARFSASIPFRHAFRRAQGTSSFGNRKMCVGKVVLREAFRNEIADSVLYRNKAVSLTNVLLMNGILGENVKRFIKEDLSSPSSFLKEFQLERMAQQICDKHNWKVTDQVYLMVKYNLGILCRYRTILQG